MGYGDEDAYGEHVHGPEPELAPKPRAWRFGDRGQVAVGVERLFGWHFRSTRNGGREATATSFALLTSNTATGQAFNPQSVPRVSLDGFIVDGFTLGGAVGFASTSIDNGGTGGDSSANTTLLLGRAGLVAALGERTALWPRGSISVCWGNVEFISYSLTVLTLEAPLVLSPTPHLAVLIVPAYDVSVGGGTEDPSGVDSDLFLSDLSLTVGVLGAF